MSAASSPPPPPPGGSGKSPASKHGTPPTGPALQKIRDKMDGTTAKNAYWTNALILKPNQPQFLVHRRTEQPPAKWQRCTEGEARYESEAGYPVWQLTSAQARRMDPLGPSSSNWDSAVERQIREIEEAEVALVDRRQYLATEDIMEGAEESDDVFDSPSLPSRSSTRTGSGSRFAILTAGFSRLKLSSSPDHSRGIVGGRLSFSEGSQSPRRLGSEGPRSPASSRPGTATAADQRPPTPRGRGSSPAGSPPQGHGSPSIGNKGKGPRRDGSGSGAAST